jgi:tetratricopeptide (TPR) repeat protein
MAHYCLGSILEHQKRYAEAEAAHREALALEPSFLAADNGLGNVLLSTGRIQEAGEAYLRALRLDQEFAPARSGLGHIFLRPYWE